VSQNASNTQPFKRFLFYQTHDFKIDKNNRTFHNPHRMKKIVEKPWGHEEWWALTEHYVAKILHIKTGESLSLQYHQKKDETIRVLSGVLQLEVEEQGILVVRVMHPGDIYHITPPTKHRMQAIEACDIIEVSTPEVEDVVRLEDRYGRITNKPST